MTPHRARMTVPMNDIERAALRDGLAYADRWLD
jgi:hypothetical protein